VAERPILEWIFKKYDIRMWAGFIRRVLSPGTHHHVVHYNHCAWDYDIGSINHRPFIHFSKFYEVMTG
jgi:hypothetical protein